LNRAVIFGGSGFIGSHLANRLSAGGAEVTIADIIEPSGGKAAFELCDVRAPIKLDSSEPFDIAFNLAAVHRTPGHADHEYYDTNVAGALNVTEWADSAQVSNIVFTSSISIYGPAETAKDEYAVPAPTSAYGRSKLLAEQIHRRWLAADPGRTLVVARPAVVFGPGERGNFTRLATALRSKRFVLPGRSDTIKACGYVEDLVDALLFVAAQRRRETIFNFAYPRPYTIEHICHAFEQIAGYSFPRKAPPAVVSVALAAATTARLSTLSERVGKLTASTNVIPQVLLDLGFDWSSDLDSALEHWLQAEPAGAYV
jgi:nucleoside-diphosphate-sugar epimerase